MFRLGATNFLPGATNFLDRATNFLDRATNFPLGATNSLNGATSLPSRAIPFSTRSGGFRGDSEGFRGDGLARTPAQAYDPPPDNGPSLQQASGAVVAHACPWMCFLDLHREQTPRPEIRGLPRARRRAIQRSPTLREVRVGNRQLLQSVSGSSVSQSMFSPKARFMSMPGSAVSS